MSATLAPPRHLAAEPHVKARPAPDAEAPYRDDVDDFGEVASDHTLGPPPDVRLPATLRVAPRVIDVRRMFGPERTPRDALEDPVPRAAMLARVMLETLAGDRPVAQLMKWISPEVHDVMQPLIAARRQRPWAASVRRVLVSEPTPGVAEVTAIIQRGPRTGALALRLEGIDGRWLVTALHLG